jgi:hypothetical protein
MTCNNLTVIFVPEFLLSFWMWQLVVCHCMMTFVLMILILIYCDFVL